jgi:RHS repeat-associated protein
MKRSKSKFVAAILFLALIGLFFPAVSFAGGQAAFGPRDFRIGMMHFHLSVHSFNVDGGGDGVILVNKKTPEKKFEGGFLLLNSQIIALHDFLEGSSQSTERKAHLRSRNFLTVFLRGTPGATISIEVRKGGAIPAPQVVFEATPQAITLGETSTLQWTTTNADRITINQGIGDVLATGTLTVAPKDTTTYTLSATGTGGATTASATVRVTVPTPTVSLSVNPDTIVQGASATLTWNSNFADTMTIQPGIGPVSANGSLTVSPSQTTTYMITVTGRGGTSNATATLTVLLPPTVTMGASPQTILAGVSSTLKWTSTNATTATIEPGIGNASPIGSMTISPQQTTTYVITVTGPGGSASASVTIKVEDPLAPPVVSISASPSTIPKGSSSTLSWACKNVQSAHIDNGIGIVPAEGTAIVSPECTTTYTITAVSANGAASARLLIIVLGNPSPQPPISFGSQYEDLIPQDATIESLDPQRFAIVTGEVRNSEKQPIEGVRITFLGYPEYGTTYSDDKGLFSITIEGGGVFTLQYSKEGFITTQRQVYVRWNDTAIVDPISVVVEDSRSTKVTLNGDPDLIVTHESTRVEDSRGARSSTLIFKGDNKGYVVDEKGDPIHELSSFTVRATEFKTPESMPAVLPPNSGFTYCAEVKVDNVERVKFRDAVTMLVDNFLGFPVGMPVPVGYYDRDRGVWVPSDNGVVVRLLDYYNSEGIADAIDIDEDGEPEERLPGLDDKSRFIPGSTYWFIKLNHLTPIDPNFPIAAPADAVDPNSSGIPYADQQMDSNVRDCLSHTSSFVEERSRIFHEDIPIPGTSLSLHYSSNRTSGYRTVITVPASGETVPASLKRIEVEVRVAGVKFEQVFDPLPNMIAQFLWDGRDHLGRMTLGPTKALVTVRFVYGAVYAVPAPVLRSFAQAGMDLTGVLARMEIVKSKSSVVTVGFEKALARGEIAEGWSLSVHHNLSFPDLTTLTKGDGTTTKNNVAIIDTLAGKGAEGHYGDGGPATEASIARPSDVTFDPAGNLYIMETGLPAVRKVDTSGVIWTIAGLGLNTCNSFGDDGPATMAGICGRGIAVGNHGELYIADTWNNLVRKVDRDGIITTIAGDGYNGYSGDGGPAIRARISYPYDIAADQWGNLFFCTGDHRIRKIDPGGIITTVVGTGVAGYSGDGGPATLARINDPRGLAADSLGNLYIADSTNARVRKVNISGVITTVAGNGTYGYSGDGGPAVEAKLWGPVGVATDVFGNLYVVERGGSRIRKIDARGVITTVAGTGTQGYSGDGDLPYEASLDRPTAIAIDPSGNLVIADEDNHRVRKVASPSAFAEFLTAGELAFPEEGGVAHIISSLGTHESTVDLITGAVLYHFMYDEENRLSSIYDQQGRATFIARDGSRTPTGIISPDSIMTRLAIDANNHLTRITLPDSSFYSFEYTSEGLMLVKTEPNGNQFEHQFDSGGRLTQTTDEEGGEWTFLKTVYDNGDVLSEVETAENNLTSYLDYKDSTGAYASIITDPLGGRTMFSQSANGLTAEKSMACGMGLHSKYDVDPEYKYRFLKEVKEKTPSGLEKVTFTGRDYRDRDNNGVPDQVFETFSINGKATILVTDKTSRQRTVTSPLGRMATTFHDPTTFLTTKMQIPGLYATIYGYDEKKRLTSITTNTRRMNIEYNPRGFISSKTDPIGRRTSYTYDAVGRVTSVLGPDGSSIYLSYDKNGNMTVLNNPADVDHVFGYNRVNKNSSYTAPLSGTYQYTYDRDRRLVQVAFPSGDVVNNVYDATRLMKIQTPEGDIDFSYECGEKIRSITKSAESISYAYDGSLVASESCTGTLDQSLFYSYNNDFLPGGFGYAGAVTNYVHDQDGLLVAAGRFSVFRDQQNGLPLQINGGNLSLTRTFNGYGEVSAQAALVAGKTALSWNLSRNGSAEIERKTEVVDNVPSVEQYTYDSMGRLRTVVRDGALVEEYQYGANGARVYEMNTRRGISGRSFAYSEEDHLLSVDGGETRTSYEYDVDGFLTKKVQGASPTDYRYSSRGELLEVVLPDGAVVGYVHDPLGRRIAKKVNGIILEKYLWQGMTRLLAVYDGNDNLLMRFEYADGRVPMAMTKAGAVYYLVHDQVGSLRAVVDGSGNVVKRIDYDSFGNILYDSNPGFAMPFGFAGGLLDRDTGLVRFGFRDYDPDIGRWTARDPILFVGGSCDLYGYVGNSPTNSTDSAGLKGGALIPIRAWLKKNLGADSIIGSILQEGIDIPLTPSGILLYDFLNPRDAGIPNEDFFIPRQGEDANDQFMEELMRRQWKYLEPYPWDPKLPVLSPCKSDGR